MVNLAFDAPSTIRNLNLLIIPKIKMSLSETNNNSMTLQNEDVFI